MHDILLVEDDDRLRSILTRALEQRGHAVRGARLGAEARALLTAKTDDVVLLDINLPDETGWDVLRWLRRQPCRQPRVVVMTAARPPQTRTRELKPDAVITKPFPIDALTRLVEGVRGEAAD
jgi:DNA-binding response OmpR family regulator